MKKKIVSVMLIFALVMSSFTFMIDDADAANKVWKEYNPDRYGDVTKTAALRSKSSSKSKSLGTIRKGTRVQIYGYDKYPTGSWYKVKYGKKIGYIYAKKVKLSYKSYNPVKIGVTTANIYMRSGVGLNYSKKVYIKKGAKINLHGYYRTAGYDWYKISYGGSTGYASSKYIKREVLSAGPVINKFITTKSYVKVYWQEAKYASSYEVYRKEGKGKYKKIATVKRSTLQYVDKKIKAGKSYTYKIVSKKGRNKYESDGRKITPSKIAAPKLKHVKRYTSDGREKIQFNWQAKNGGKYYVYKKTVKGSWTKLATVNTATSVGTYTDTDVKKGTDYLYTAKEVRKTGSISYAYSEYDDGIKTIAGMTKVSVDAGNLNAKVSWEKVPGATAYKVYRKVGETGSYRLLATVKGTSYIDVYKKNAKTEEEKKCQSATNFVDPSINPFVYTVRAYNYEKGKESYSDYDRVGDFHLEAPTITTVDKNDEGAATIEWSVIRNAKSYIIYSGYNDGNEVQWKQVKEVANAGGIRQKTTINADSSHTYFSVQAKAIKNGEEILSDFDKGFNIENKKYGDKNILFLGDSITFGSPYKAASTVEVFSYPWRLQQLTGVKFYNPSIPGSTYAYRDYVEGTYKRYRIVDDVALPIKEGATPKGEYNGGTSALHPNTQTYKDFDVVVMAAGTNDYSDNIQLGSFDSTDKTEFNGAVNTIMSYIKEGSDQRVKEGKAPIKIVFVDLFYSDRTNNYAELTNRFVTPNEIGLTLTDYQNDLDGLFQKYKDEGFDMYHFETEDIVTQENCPKTTSDNLHMSRYTYGQIGNKMANYLIENGILD